MVGVAGNAVSSAESQLACEHMEGLERYGYRCEDWSDEVIEAAILAYADGVKQRRVFDPSVERGELHDGGRTIVDFLRLFDVSIPMLKRSFEDLKQKAESLHNPAPVNWETWKDFGKNVDERLKELQTKQSAWNPYIFTTGALPDVPTLEGTIIEHAKELAQELAPVTFQQNHPNYFPPDFWRSKLLSDVASPPFWKSYHQVLLAAWACGFADDYVVHLLKIPSIDGTTAEDALKEQESMLTRTLDFRPPYRIQHDVLALVRSPWRAALCRWCQKPFVADKTIRKFCPEHYASDPAITCYNEHRRAEKRECWNKHRTEWRKPKQTSTSEQKDAHLTASNRPLK